MHEEGTFENYYSTYNLIKVFKIEKKNTLRLTVR